MSGERPRLVAAQRAAIELYPPALHQLRLLADTFDIDAIDAPRAADPAPLTPPPVERRRVGPVAALPALDVPVVRLGRFAATVAARMATRPVATIAWDAEAAAIALLAAPLAPGSRLVVHLHEEFLSSTSATHRAAHRVVVRMLRRADLVISPDAHRAGLIREEAHLDEAPRVVMNCPPRMDALPRSLLRPWLAERGHGAARVVHYHGAVGADHGLEDLVRSMGRWPDDAVLVIVGDAEGPFAARLVAIARAIGAGDRLLLPGRQRWDRVLPFAASADVGVVLFDDGRPMWRHTAGASNKRFEYLGLGVPVVTTRGIGVDALFGREEVVRLVPPGDVEALGAAIAGLLTDEAARRAMGERARRAHLARWNYEAQFAPVREQLERWSIDASRRRSPP